MLNYSTRRFPSANQSGESTSYSKEKLHLRITFPHFQVEEQSSENFPPLTFSPKLSVLFMNLVFQKNELSASNSSLFLKEETI